MPYVFTCPHCQSKTRVEDRYSGQSGECFSCGKSIQLPAFNKDGTTLNAASQTRRPMGVLIAAGVVLTMLTCLIFALVKFGGSGVARLAEVRLQTASKKNLQAIAGALNAYAATHGTYPPAVLRDSKGRKLHSWRVLILPQLGELDKYNRFDLSKPWDDDINLQASVEMPDAYLHPSDNSGFAGNAGYFLITGPGTIFPPAGPLSPGQITDNPSQTILVIGGRAASSMPGMGAWAEPIDLDYTTMRGVINGTNGMDPGGWLDSGVTMATADGRTHFLKNETSSNIFDALVTPNGNEPLADDTLD